MEFLAIVLIYILTLGYMSYRDRIVSNQIKDVIRGMRSEDIIDFDGIDGELPTQETFDELVGLEDVSPEDLLKLKR
jgi:hypothetical protein